MTSQTELRRLAAQLEQAGWTNITTSQRAGLLSVSGTDPNGVSRATASLVSRRQLAQSIVDAFLQSAQSEQDNVS